MSGFYLVGLCGSLRARSTNRFLMNEAARRFAPQQFDEADLRLPLFDEDLQDRDGLPTAVEKLVAQISAADAVIVATPEYNKGLSGVLKNALDWISRAPGKPWLDKPVALMSATAGRSGGERTQTMTRACLVPFRPRLLEGPEVLVAQTASQWGDDDQLTNTRNAETLQELMDALRIEAAQYQKKKAAAG